MWADHAHQLQWRLIHRGVGGILQIDRCRHERTRHSCHMGSPIETSSAQVAELERCADPLRRLVGSPTDEMYSTAHAKILGHAEALPENEAQHPTDVVMPTYFGWIESNYDELGLTPENAEYGLED